MVDNLEVGAHEWLGNVDEVVEDHEDISIATQSSSVRGIDASNFRPMLDEKDH